MVLDTAGFAVFRWCVYASEDEGFVWCGCEDVEGAG